MVNNTELEIRQKKKAIITVCATGKGTSLMLAKMVHSSLEEWEEDICIFPFNYSEVQNHTDEFEKIRKEYDIIACVGNIQPDIDVPYFSLEELFDEVSKQRFFKFIKSVIQANHNGS